jgi:hypothetical protein
MSGLRGVTLTVRFLCELLFTAAVAALAAALAAARQAAAAVVLGVAALTSSLLNAWQEARIAAETPFR